MFKCLTLRADPALGEANMVAAVAVDTIVLVRPGVTAEVVSATSMYETCTSIVAA